MGRHYSIKASLLGAIAVGTVVVTLPHGAMAQESGGNQLDTISVEGQGSEDPKGPAKGFVANRTETGTKTNTPRIETPQAVSIVSRDQMDTLKPRSLLEATRYSPGVRENSGGGDTRTDLFRIRGFSAEATGLYLNGLQLPSPGFAIFRLEPFGLDRIEILRGPSSVLYGGTNPGGLINAVSKRPTSTPFGHVETGVNQYGNAYGAFDIGGPVNKTATSGVVGDWTYRFTGLGKMGDTQTDHIQDNRWFFAPAVTWRPNADTSLTVMAQYQYDRSNNLNFLPYVGTVTAAPFGRIPTKLFTGEPAVDKIEREQALIGYEFEHRFNDVFTVRQNFRYSHVNTEYYNPAARGYVTPPTATSGLLNRATLTAQPSLDVFNVDNQLEARFATGPLQHTALFGVDYKRLSYNDRQGFGASPTINVVNPVYNQPIPTAVFGTNIETAQGQLGVYLQDQVKFDRFTLVLSGRQDSVRTDSVNNLAPASSYVGNDSAFSGRAGLIYTSDIGLAPYVSYSKSFQPQIGLNATTLQPLVPETGEQYEVGVKFQPLGWNSFVSVAAFDLKRQNFLTSNPLNFAIQDQNGEARSRGFEFEAVAHLTDGLKLVGAFTTFDIKNTQNLDTASIGKVPAGVPDQFGSVFMDYTIQTGALRNFGFGYGVRYNGKSYADTLNTLEVPTYVLNDAVLHYERDGWRAALNFTNLFDKTFVSVCTSAIQCFYGERRTIMASLAYKW